MSKKRPSPNEVVIDLCHSSSDDDDADQQFFSRSTIRGRRSMGSTRKRLKTGETPRQIKSETAAASRNRSSSNSSSTQQIKSERAALMSDTWWGDGIDDDDVVIVSDGRDDAGNAASSLPNNNAGAEEVTVVERQRQIVPAAAAAGLSNATASASASATGGAGDEVELVGTVNELRLPHARNDCLEKPFQGDENYSLHMRKTVNQQFCDCCYCYVCEVKAGECQSWNEHCLATDKGPKKLHWLQQRQARKQSQQQTTTAVTTAPRRALVATGPRGRGRPRLPGQSRVKPIIATTTGTTLAGSAPYPPNNVAAQRCAELTKCQHCGWYNSFVHKNFKYIREVESGQRIGISKPSVKRNQINPTGPQDWCRACGRVASVRDYGKVQSKPFNEDSKDNVGSVLLGEKTIGFRLRAHDPRNMHVFRARWQQHEGEEGWKNGDDVRAMEKELFQHRFGARPTLEMIFGSIPIYKEDKIPHDGNFQHQQQQSSEYDYDDTTTTTTHDWSASETEALLVEHKKDRALLCDLYDVAPTFGLKQGTVPLVDGDIRANWNAKARKGVRFCILYSSLRILKETVL